MPKSRARQFWQCGVTDSGSRFVLVPADLVALVAEGKISKEAGWLYIVLLGHHNRTRRDNDVWPSRAVMAQGMGLKKPQSVDKYLDELRGAGLIVSERRKRASDMNTSSRHTLLLFVPRTAEEIAVDRARREAIPYNGQRYPRQRTADVPSRGQELDEGELDQLKENELMSRTSGRFASGGFLDEALDGRRRPVPFVVAVQFDPGDLAVRVRGLLCRAGRRLGTVR